jgi:hypothetical protein
MTLGVVSPTGLPVVLTPAAVSQRWCVECGSQATWLMRTHDWFRDRSLINRLCDACGRVTAAYLPARAGNCGHCNGTGWIGDLVCPACNGTGG